MRTLRALEEATGRAANLQAAMQSREAIEQAKGILMERHRITAEVAFAELREASQTTNRKLREVAEHLVATGELLRR
jgi:AmiR/NasT family two-component response regulator